MRLFSLFFFFICSFSGIAWTCRIFLANNQLNYRTIFILFFFYFVILLPCPRSSHVYKWMNNLKVVFITIILKIFNFYIGLSQKDTYCFFHLCWWFIQKNSLNNFIIFRVNTYHLTEKKFLLFFAWVPPSVTDSMQKRKLRIFCCDSCSFKLNNTTYELVIASNSTQASFDFLRIFPKNKLNISSKTVYEMYFGFI